MLQQRSSKIQIVLNFQEYHQNKLKSSTHFKILCYKNIHGCKGKHRIECEWRKIRTNMHLLMLKVGVIRATTIFECDWVWSLHLPFWC